MVREKYNQRYGNANIQPFFFFFKLLIHVKQVTQGQDAFLYHRYDLVMQEEKKPKKTNKKNNSPLY